MSKVKLPTAPTEQFVLYLKVKFYVENIALLRLVLSSNPISNMHHKKELGQVFVNCLPSCYGQQIFYIPHFNNHENLASVPKNVWTHREMWSACKGDKSYQYVFGLSSKNLVVVCPNSFVQHAK